VKDKRENTLYRENDPILSKILNLKIVFGKIQQFKDFNILGGRKSTPAVVRTNDHQL